MMKSRKAVSPVIAVILLIAIAVAASVTVFAYTQGILGGVTQANLAMSNAQIVGNELVVTIQNTGGTSAEIDEIDVTVSGPDPTVGEITNAVTGELYDSNGDSGDDTNLVVGAGSSVTIMIGPTFSSGNTYTIQLWLSGNTGGTPNFEATFAV